MKFIKGMIIGITLGAITGMVVGATNSDDICSAMKAGKREMKRFKRKYC